MARRLERGWAPGKSYNPTSGARLQREAALPGEREKQKNGTEITGARGQRTSGRTMQATYSADARPRATPPTQATGATREIDRVVNASAADELYAGVPAPRRPSPLARFAASAEHHTARLARQPQLQ